MDDIVLAGGGVAAAREKLFGGFLRKFQRVTLASGDRMTRVLVTLDVNGVQGGTTLLLARNDDRVAVQVVPRGTGDVLLADSATELGVAACGDVLSGEAWDSREFVGEVHAKAKTGTVVVLVEEVS